MAHPEVRGIELFGSVAREGSGNDLDFIILASPALAAKFFASEVKQMKERGEAEPCLLHCVHKYGYSGDEPDHFLDKDFQQLLVKAKRVLPRNQTYMDVLVLPVGWRKKEAAIMKIFPRMIDDGLWDDIFYDARRIA